MPFTCNICEEESTRICIACTKDSCDNHLCEKCSKCSDCCGCEVKLDETVATEHAAEHHTEAPAESVAADNNAGPDIAGPPEP